MSRRLSAQVIDKGGEFGALDQDDQGITKEIYSRDIRKKKVRNLIIWGFVNAFLCGYIFALLVIFWESWKTECVKQLNIWLLVYLVL